MKVTGQPGTESPLGLPMVSVVFPELRADLEAAMLECT